MTAQFKNEIVGEDVINEKFNLRLGALEGMRIDAILNEASPTSANLAPAAQAMGVPPHSVDPATGQPIAQESDPASAVERIETEIRAVRAARDDALKSAAKSG